MSNDLIKIHSDLPYASEQGAIELKKRFEEHKKAIMQFLKENEDYGVVVDKYGKKPFGDKPCLFKSGADKLAFLFGLSVEIVKQERFFHNNVLEWTVQLNIKTKDKVISFGLGSYSSAEQERFKYNPLRWSNTILKMAYKRAFVSGVISATRISGLFTQDIEEYVDNNNVPKNVNKNASTKNGNEKTRKMLYALLNQYGIDKEEFKSYCIEAGLIKESTNELGMDAVQKLKESLEAGRFQKTLQDWKNTNDEVS